LGYHDGGTDRGIGIGAEQLFRPATGERSAVTIAVGQPVPGATVEYWRRDAPGAKKMALADLKGSWVVLFFYPRDFSFLCPGEIAAFAALHDDFTAAGATVIGASTDSYFSHNAWFAQDSELKDVDFPVIADTSHELARLFGVLLSDGSALRGTFIIDPEGILRFVSVYDLDVARNVAEVLRALRALRSGELCPAGWQSGDENHTTYNEWLARVFPKLKKSALAEATQRLRPILYERGDIIIHQGGPPDRFFIIAAGQVSVIRRTRDGGEVELARLAKGDAFGEMGILTGNRRTADVRANTDVTAYALAWDDFKALIDISEPTAKDFMQIVDQRMKALPE
jgi:peroxiredoxin (alkyl hydroperoxide reductase subunit C)